MRVVLFFTLAVVASAAALVEVKSGYHDTVGIPRFEEIRAYEEGLSKNQGRHGDRIVGGAISAVGAHPYFAGLLINLLNVAGQSVCGATLLTANRLVTAAHCWYDGQRQAWRFTVILGSNLLLSGGTRIATTQVTMHPQWIPSTLTNDVAMIYLPTNVFFTATIRPIDIPNTSEVFDAFVGQWATAVGFGRTSDQQAGASSILSQVNIQVISTAQCQATFGTVFVQQSTLCTNGAGGVGICGGDSGGPLVLNYNGRPILIGVSSFVAQIGCQLGFPSAFARVTSFRNYITQHL